MNVSGKYLMTNYGQTNMEWACCRVTLSTILTLVFLSYKGITFEKDMPKGRALPLLIIMLSGAGTQIFFGNAIHFLPLTIANVILCVLPFVNALGGLLIFKERIQMCTVVAMVISFAAINLLTIAQPAELPAILNDQGEPVFSTQA